MDRKLPFKLVMQSIKFFIGRLPLNTRKKLRSSQWLYTLYSKSLHNSGLFYGVPSAKKLNKLYLKVIERQAKLIEKIDQQDKNKNITLDVLVVLSSNHQTNSQTLQSLASNQRIGTIFLHGQPPEIEQYVDKVCGDDSATKYRDASQITESQPTLLLLRGGDRLHPKAVAVYLSQLNSDVSGQVLYCDCDSIDGHGNRVSPEFYPDWNPDLQLSTGYVKTGVLLVGKTLVARFAKTFIERIDPQLVAQWMVDIYLTNKSDAVTHIPISLVHQEISKAPSWFDGLNRYQQDHKSEFDVKASDNQQVVSIEWPLTAQPLVSLIIPTKNAKQLVKVCIESIIEKTCYPNYEILLVDNNSDDPESIDYFDQLEQTHARVRVLKYPYGFNYSAINNFAAGHAHGDILGLINNDIEVISGSWLTDMVSHTLRPDIGCVGAKLFYPDKRIQHAGVVMGYGGGAGHAHKYFPDYHPGYMNRLIASHNYSVVTAACLLVKASDYHGVGGLNERDLTVAFNDVDFCLRVLSLGRRNLYCAEAQLFHHESISRGLDNTTEKRLRFEQELEYLQRNWQSFICADPAYNPNLTLKRENFSLKEREEYGCD